jgi:hypothetical protein
MSEILFKKNVKSTGAYRRLFGDGEVASELSNIFTSVHSATIRNGNDTCEKLKHSYIGDLKIFSGKDVNTPKKTLKVLSENQNGVIIFNGFIGMNGDLNSKKKQEIDVIVCLNNGLYCFELKEGNNLDTKKSKIELDFLENCKKYFFEKNFKIFVGLVCMNMENQEHQIKDKRISKYLYSGKRFCDEFGFDYIKYCELYKNKQPNNVKIMIESLRNVINLYDNSKK